MLEIERLQEMTVEEWAYFRLAALEHQRTGRLSVYALLRFYAAQERANHARKD